MLFLSVQLILGLRRRVTSGQSSGCLGDCYLRARPKGMNVTTSDHDGCPGNPDLCLVSWPAKTVGLKRPPQTPSEEQQVAKPVLTSVEFHLLRCKCGSIRPYNGLRFGNYVDPSRATLWHRQPSLPQNHLVAVN